MTRDGRLILLSALFSVSCVVRDAVELTLAGDTNELRERPDDAPERSPRHPPLLVLAIDGVDRTTLYELLEQGHMPHLASLIGGSERDFERAYFEPKLLSTLPSTTMAAWVTAFTGKPPSEHGVTGNELFIREKKTFGAPVPVSFSNLEPLVENLTEGYTNELLLVPTVFERMRERDPNVLIWVAMLPVHKGADLLLQSDRTAFADAAKAFMQKEVIDRLTAKESRALYQALDQQVIDAVVEQLEDEDNPLPDVLVVYVSGNDQYAHVSKERPDKARGLYLREALDPELGKLVRALEKRKALDRWVVVTSDHGHTNVVSDEAHALGTDSKDDPPAVLAKAGFRVRPFEWKVDAEHDFQSVLAYQGAIAYVYLADRSTCREKGRPCDWKRPPRFREDVLVAAEAFFRASRDGWRVPAMKGTLDLVLARRPRPAAEVDEPFQVYVGNGRLRPLGEYLDDYPHDEYVNVVDRLGDLASGPAGERAGDLLLIAVNGNRERPDERYYFSSPYSSWHGSPSRRDSEIPLIVAHPKKSKAEIRETVAPLVGDAKQQRIADVLIGLRYGR